MIRVLLTTFILLIPTLGWSKSFTIKSISVNCDLSSVCKRFEDKLGSLKKEVLTPSKLRNKLRPYLFDNSIATFSYEVRETSIGIVLKIIVTSRKIINDISFEIEPDTINSGGIKNLLPYYEGEYHNPDLDGEAEAGISKFLIDAGVADPKVQIKQVIQNGTVNLIFKINFTKTIIIKKVNINYEGKRDPTFLFNRLNNLKDSIYNKKEINILINDISKELFDSGYFFSELVLKHPKFDKAYGGLDLEFDLDFGVKVNVAFFGNRIISRSTLMNMVRDQIRAQGIRLEPEDIIKEINELYKERGFYYNKVSFQKMLGKSKFGEDVETYYFNIKEGTKLDITSLTFQGNRLINDERLRDLFEDKGTSLSSRYFLDEKFLKSFKNILREEYLEKGFIATDISNPIVELQEKTKSATIIYNIKESLICQLTDIKYLRAVPEEIKSLIEKRLQNKKGKAFNILNLEKELEKVLDVARENGYYFSKVFNTNDRTLLKFSADYKEVEIILDLDLGKKSYFNALQISGNLKSKDRVIERESIFKKGEILKYKDVDFFKERISSLGLFKTVKITPVVLTSWVDEGEPKQSIDLITEVKERDSITLAIGPGFRTDAGLKLSSRVRFLNIGGMNRRVNLLAHANQRLSLVTLDAQRQEEGLRILEYRFRVDYEEPYFFHLPLEYDISGTVSRNRYFSFDADILTGTMAFSKDFSKVISTNIKYQYDNIYQFNATSIKDEGSFRVGAITPSLNLDFRDNPGVPRKGSWYGLSLEFATPALGSINIENFEVNYLKLISRNKWYVKLAQKWGLAASLVIGYEKNYADEPLLDAEGNPQYTKPNNQVITKGFIPSIKVFRIEGIDIVRGFQETEINRLSNTGSDVLNWLVNNTAYYTVFKFEARHYIRDSFIVAPFFDAGRVFVNKFNILDLRASMGLSFKLLTPVGSLDLDFGVKLRRESYPDGTTDQFGRFHLLIGYF